MKEIKKEERDKILIKDLLNVWEDSVRATHKFLSDEEILEIICTRGTKWCFSFDYWNWLEW